MERSVTKGELLALIATGLADAEEGIRSHPSETVSVYEEGKRAILHGQADAEESDWSRSAGFSLNELATAYNYLSAMAFISAWYHLNGNRAKRDAATSPPCLLVSGLLGFSPEDVLRRYLEFEIVWRRLLKPAKWWQLWK